MNKGVPDLVRFCSLYDRFLANQNKIFQNSAIKGRGESWLVADIVRTAKVFNLSLMKKAVNLAQAFLRLDHLSPGGGKILSKF